MKNRNRGKKRRSEMKLFTSRFKFRKWHHSDEVCQACESFLFVRFEIGRKMLLCSVNLQLIVMARCFSQTILSGSVWAVFSIFEWADERLSMDMRNRDLLLNNFEKGKYCSNTTAGKSLDDSHFYVCFSCQTKCSCIFSICHLSLFLVVSYLLQK